MKKLYPFTVMMASDRQAAIHQHHPLVAEVAASVSHKIHLRLPYLNEKSFKGRSGAYAEELAHLLMHVPEGHLAEAESDLMEGAIELLMHRAEQAPRAFELVCVAGHHLALPGALSLSDADSSFAGFREAHGTSLIPTTIEMVEIVMQRAERRLEWINDGRPDDRDPRIDKNEAGPEDSFIERYISSMPKNWKDDTRISKAGDLVGYARHGQRLLSVRWDRWSALGRGY